MQLPTLRACHRMTIPTGACSHCHPERSEGSLISVEEILRFAQNDTTSSLQALRRFSRLPELLRQSPSHRMASMPWRAPRLRFLE